MGKIHKKNFVNFRLHLLQRGFKFLTLFNNLMSTVIKTLKKGSLNRHQFFGTLTR